jgi:hypothetical protein
MIDPTGHEANLNLDPPDEPDELDLVYADLEKANLEIERLKTEIETLKRHWVEDSRDLNELISLCKRAADALELDATDSYMPVIERLKLITELREAAE